MLVTKFIYDLRRVPEPSNEELDEEIDRLLKVKTVEQVTYKVSPQEQDRSSQLDSEVIQLWIQRRFEPALILWMFDTENNNYSRANEELGQMEKYNTYLDKVFRINFLERRAMQRIRELCFDDIHNLDLPRVILRLKRLLTFLSKHLEEKYPDRLTLQGFDAYTSADEFLYKYLKRILFGKYKDQGLRTHVKLCDPLTRFMGRLEKKNPYVQAGDPAENEDEESSLIKDSAPWSVISIGLILFFLWRVSKD